MRLFLKRLLLFVLPLAVPAIAMEALLRHIPNDYRQKSRFLSQHSDSIAVLYLGNSHTFYGINPGFSKFPGYNAAYISQSVNLDEEIFEHYSWKNLKCVVVQVSYPSLFNRLETSVEAWRAKNYAIYYGFRPPDGRWSEYSEVLSNKIGVNIQRLRSFYIDKKPNASATNTGWGFLKPKAKKDLALSGKISANRHRKKNDDYYEANVNCIKRIVALAAQQHIHVILYTPPAFHSYVENLDPQQWRQTLSTLKELDRLYDNVEYVDFMTDPAFTENDFFDGDHLDANGAKKMTWKMDSVLVKAMPRQ